jgi:hypothetical protein
MDFYRGVERGTRLVVGVPHRRLRTLVRVASPTARMTSLVIAMTSLPAGCVARRGHCVVVGGGGAGGFVVAAAAACSIDANSASTYPSMCVTTGVVPFQLSP